MYENKPEAISLYQFFQQFPNEEATRLYFQKNAGMERIFAVIAL